MLITILAVLFYAWNQAVFATSGLINKELENEINTYAVNNKPQATINKISAIMEARVNLGHNAAPLLTVEALMCVLAR